MNPNTKGHVAAWALEVPGLLLTAGAGTGAFRRGGIDWKCNGILGSMASHVTRPRKVHITATYLTLQWRTKTSQNRPVVDSRPCLFSIPCSLPLWGSDYQFLKVLTLSQKVCLVSIMVDTAIYGKSYSGGRYASKQDHVILGLQFLRHHLWPMLKKSQEQWLLGFNLWVWKWCVIFRQPQSRNGTGTLEPQLQLWTTAVELSYQLTKYRQYGAPRWLLEISLTIW